MVLANKYAHAYFNIFNNATTYEDIEHFSEVFNMLQKNYYGLMLFSLPTVSAIDKIIIIDKVCEFAKINKGLHRLTRLLMKHQRLFLIPAIVQHLKRLYDEYHNQIRVKIISSHALDNEQIDLINAWFSKKIKKKIKYNTVVNTSLIAGLRIQSDTWLWQYCVRQQLQNLLSSSH